MNTPEELRAAEAAMANAMAANAAHQSWTEQSLRTPAGGIVVEQPQTVDDIATTWSGWRTRSR